MARTRHPRKPKLPRVPVPKPGGAFEVKKDRPFRKRKHKGRDDE
jgi:hypothetical protein